jgi:hypothetical protein
MPSLTREKEISVAKSMEVKTGSQWIQKRTDGGV